MADMFIDNLKTISADNWTRPWKASNIASPFNGFSKRYYSGSNQFFLMLVSYAKDYKDPRWYTFNQISSSGYKLQKGSKGVPVEYWFPVLYDEKGNKKRQLSWSEFSKLSKDQRDLCQIRFKTSYVYNGSCIDGLPELDINANEDIRLSDLVDRISYEMKVPIIEDGGNSAFYSPLTDSIHLPQKETFTDEISFNSTALHELSHATGHHSRLNRLTGAVFGSEDYAFEELIAEISSTFMAPYIGSEINDDYHNKNHIAYVNSWIAAIQNDPEVLFKAIAKAEVAASFLEWKGGIINELEFAKSLKNAHVALGEDEKVKLIENLYPRESINLIGDEDGAKEYVRKLIANTEDMAQYFDDLEFNVAKAEVSLDYDRLEFKAYKTELFGAATLGLAVYQNGKLIYSSALDEESKIVDRSSLIDAAASLITSSYGEVSYGFEQSSGAIKASQIRAIEEKQELAQSTGEDPAAAVNKEDLYKDEEKVLENHADELADIEKFIDDHEKLLAERNVKQTPIYVNLFYDDQTKVLAASMNLISELNRRGYRPGICESYIDPRNKDLSEADLYDSLKYHIERTDRVYETSDIIINEAPLLLNAINSDMSDQFNASLNRLVNQYRNFNVYLGSQDDAFYKKLKTYTDRYDMFLGHNDLDSFDKLIDNIIKNKERLQKKTGAKEAPTLDNYRQRQKEELDLLKDSIDIKEYARDVLGFNVVKASKGLYSLKEHDSVMIYPENNFTRYSNHAGGSIIDFIKEFNAKADGDEAKAIALAKEYYNRYHPEKMNVYSSSKQKINEELMFDQKKERIAYMRSAASNYSRLNPDLPTAAKSSKKMETYLSNDRGLSKETIKAWKDKDLIYQDEHNNVVFLGRDFDNNVKYYFLRGTDDKNRFVHDSPSESSTKTNGIVFENRNARYLYVAEAAIDAMSLMDILGGPEIAKDSSFLSLQSAGNSAALARYLSTRDTSKLEAVFLCQDADAAGMQSVEECKELIREFEKKGMLENRISVSRLSPKTGYKDFNEELVGSRRMQEQQSQSRSPTPDVTRTPALSPVL